MLPVGVGDEIRLRRERAGFTQEALAAMLGVLPDTVDQWEWGEAVPGPAEVRRLAAILGLPGGEGPGPAADDGTGQQVVVQLLVPGKGRSAGALGPTGVPPAGLFLVPPRPAGLPPAPAAMPWEARRGGPAERGERRSFEGDRGGLLRRAALTAGAVLLVVLAALGSLAGYQQGQAAARAEAEARALRSTLVTLAAERDRLAARLVELTEILTEAGVVLRGVTAGSDG